jgi:ubiquinone/menaquinone biosynthesis C-methylase UbiE
MPIKREVQAADGSHDAAVDYFNSNAEYYAKSQYRTSRRTFINSRHDHIARILKTLALPSTATALDAGCGPGNLEPELARRFGHVCAMDASPRMVEIARSSCADDNVSYQIGDIEALPFADGVFDVVCSAGVIEYLPRFDQALSEMRRVLRPGGILILPTTNSSAPSHWLRPLMERIGRIPLVARSFGIRPGNYRLFYQRIPYFKGRLQAADFVIEQERHFYLTLPRPLDRMFPATASSLESFFDGYMNTALGRFAEGYIAVTRKPRR